MLSAIIGSAIGSAIDGADGEDSTLDGALGGAVAGLLVRGLAPIVMTYAVGWLVLHGIGKAKDAMGDAIFNEGKKA